MRINDMLHDVIKRLSEKNVLILVQWLFNVFLSYSLCALFLQEESFNFCFLFLYCIGNQNRCIWNSTWSFWNHLVVIWNYYIDELFNCCIDCSNNSTASNLWTRLYCKSNGMASWSINFSSLIFILEYFSSWTQRWFWRQ